MLPTRQIIEQHPSRVGLDIVARISSVTFMRVLWSIGMQGFRCLAYDQDSGFDERFENVGIFFAYL